MPTPTRTLAARALPAPAKSKIPSKAAYFRYRIYLPHFRTADCIHQFIKHRLRRRVVSLHKRSRGLGLRSARKTCDAWPAKKEERTDSGARQFPFAAPMDPL